MSTTPKMATSSSRRPKPILACANVLLLYSQHSTSLVFCMYTARRFVGQEIQSCTSVAVPSSTTVAVTTLLFGKMQWRVLLVFTLAIVCCSLIDSGEGNRLPLPLKHHTTARHDTTKHVPLLTNRRCPMGHLLDKNGVCRMIW